MPGSIYLEWNEDIRLRAVGITQIKELVMRDIQSGALLVNGSDDYLKAFGLTDDQKPMYATPYLERVIASGSYPNIARYFAEDVRIDPEQGFACGLECVLNGLATRILRR